MIALRSLAVLVGEADMGYSIHRLFGLHRPGVRLARSKKEAGRKVTGTSGGGLTYWLLRYFGAGAVLAALSWSGTAQAALVNDYSQSDDVWNTPVPPGHFLIDTRILYS